MKEFIGHLIVGLVLLSVVLVGCTEAKSSATASSLPEVEDVMEAIAGFFVDARFHVIASMIFVDLGLGLSAAVRSGEFDWARVGDFYRTNVAPYIVSYLVLYVAFDVMPGLGSFVDQSLKSLAFAAIVAALGGSIQKNLGKIGLKTG